MGTFSLDTSGDVTLLPEHSGTSARYWRWTALDAFTRGYVGALFQGPWEAKNVDLRASAIVSGKDNSVRIDVLGFSDLSPAALALILKDCAAVQKTFRPLCPDAELGRCFWHGRNVIGSGNEFHDAGFPPLTVSLGDDGKVNLSDKAGS